MLHEHAMTVAGCTSCPTHAGAHEHKEMPAGVTSTLGEAVVPPEPLAKQRCNMPEGTFSSRDDLSSSKALITSLQRPPRAKPRRPSASPPSDLQAIKEQCACCSAGGLDLDELRFPRHWGSSALLLQAGFALVGGCGGLQNFLQARETRALLLQHLQERKNLRPDVLHEHEQVYRTTIGLSASLQHFYQWGSGVLPIVNGVFNGLHVLSHGLEQQCRMDFPILSSTLSSAHGCAAPRLWGIEKFAHALHWLNPAALAMTSFYASVQAGRLLGWEYPRVAFDLQPKASDPLYGLLKEGQWPEINQGLDVALKIQSQRYRFVVAGGLGFGAMALGSGLWWYEATASLLLLPWQPALCSVATACFLGGMVASLILNNWQLSTLAYSTASDVFRRDDLLRRENRLAVYIEPQVYSQVKGRAATLSALAEAQQGLEIRLQQSRHRWSTLGWTDCVYWALLVAGKTFFAMFQPLPLTRRAYQTLSQWETQWREKRRLPPSSEWMHWERKRAAIFDHFHALQKNCPA